MASMKLWLLVTILSLVNVPDGIFASDVGNTTEAATVPIYDHYRLPMTVKPNKYLLRVITHLEDPQDLYFEGDVVIQLKVLQDTDNITLHAQNLTIDSKSISLKSFKQPGNANCIKSTAVNTVHSYYIMHLCMPIKHNDVYMLRIPFKAPLNQNLHGYYRSSYHDRASNETRWLSVTQFEPASARVAFPCFDEPELKANFTIKLGHHRNYTALSNMPLKATKNMTSDGNWLWSEFKESVPMSTYLVAYTINDFAHVTSPTNVASHVTFRTWARRDAIDQCQYASEVGPKVLQFYEDIFKIKFPLEKMDQMAVPDFSAGAMENWGLVTYRETALLYAQNVSSAANKGRVASVIAHELAHQWFGNLVTMKWWTDLWLNEGFATYVASLGVENLSPEWRFLEKESVVNTMTIFRLDALMSSHPVSKPIESVSQISEIFDSISYKKGSTVLRMLHLSMGDDAFRHGINNYLEIHKYKNAEQDDLWSSLTASSIKFHIISKNFDIKQVMDSWTLQTGYPVVSVTRDYEKNIVVISQERYILNNKTDRTHFDSCWWVPLSYTTEKVANFNITTPKTWLECDDSGAVTKIITDMPDRDQWIIFNIQMAGLYKVQYDDHNLQLLIETLRSDNFKTIHIINRAQLIDDALTLAWSGDQDYAIATRLVDYLTREKEYIPWRVALDNLANVKRILRQTAKYDQFKKYMQRILTPIYVHLHGINATNLPIERHNDLLLKVLSADWMCGFDVPDCVSRANAYFVEWTRTPDPDNNNTIPTDLRSIVYCVAIRHGSADDWKFLWQRYKNSNVAAEKRTILSALGCSHDEQQLQHYLELTFNSSSGIRKQDSTLAFDSIARSVIGYPLVRKYFINKIHFLYDFYEPDNKEFVRLITSLANHMFTLDDYNTIKDFVHKHENLFQKSEQAVRRALETIQLNADWHERNWSDFSSKLYNYEEQ